MTENNIPTIIQHLEKQLDHRLDKLWKVFSWTSSLLVTITGGLVVIALSSESELEISQRILISIVIFILTLYAYQWIRENLNLEKVIREQLVEIFKEKLNYQKIDEIKPLGAKYGYSVVVLMIGAVAFITTWLDRICFIN